MNKEDVINIINKRIGVHNAHRSRAIEDLDSQMAGRLYIRIDELKDVIKDLEEHE